MAIQKEPADDLIAQLEDGDFARRIASVGPVKVGSWELASIDGPITADDRTWSDGKTLYH